MRIASLRHYVVVTMLSLSLLGWSNIIYSETQPDQGGFKKLFNDWTRAFNERDLAKSCDLFSKEIVADYQGMPRKNYTTICDGFKKIFSDPSCQYHYQFKLHEIYQSGPLAAVRVTWYLKILNKDNTTINIQDEGFDIFEKNSKGQWKVVNYLSYAVKKSNT